MRFFLKWLKINKKHSGKIILQLFATILISVVSITVALSMVKSSRLLYLDEILARYGNYDVAFCQVDDSTKNKIESDTRVDKIGYIYDLGEGYFTNGKGTVEVGCLSGDDTEKMYYVNPVKGRYPQNENEICVDNVTLKENGYEGKIGETINLSVKGYKKTTYTLVGVIELQKQDSGEIYDTRYYPEKMYSLDNMKNINFPYAYICPDNVTEYKALHLLVNAKKDAAAFIDSYLQDSSLRDLHIATDLVCGRDWAVLCLVGGEANGTSYSEVINSTLENENQKYDGYTKYLVPILLILIFVISFIGIVDALRKDSIDKYHYYSLFMRLGLRSKTIALYYFIEKMLLLLMALLLGFIGGNGIYLLILTICKNKFDIYLPSVFDFDNYYLRYLDKMTINPYIAATVVSTGCVLIAAMIMSFHLLKLKPIEMEMKSIRKVKRKKRTESLSSLLERYAWGEKNIYQFLPRIIIILFMVTTVFGYQFFASKSIDDTKEMKTQIEEARINGFDFYMYQNNERYAGYTQYMHNTGITVQQYNALQENKNVENVLPVMEEYSTAICLEKKEDKCNILASQKYVPENTLNDVNSKLAYKAEIEELKLMGLDTKKEALFHVPTIGIPMDDLKNFCETRLLAGDIDVEKIKSGEQVVLMISDQMVQSYFEIGEKLSLKDVVRNKEYDESTETLLGQINLDSIAPELKYTVESDGTKKEFCCWDFFQNYESSIGAIVLVDSYEDAMYFDSDNNINMVNILTSTDAFGQWGLPNINYNKMGVTLKNNDVSHLKEFEVTWDELLGTLDYMKSTDVYSIVKQRQKLMRQTMAIFYAMLVMTTLLGLLSIYHSIEMDVYSKEKQYTILRGLGMKKSQFAWAFMRRYLRTIFAGIIMSIFVVGGYSLVVRYASNALEKAYQKDTYDMLVAKKPWMEILPKYDLLNTGMVLPEILMCMLCVMIIAGIISKTMKKFEKKGGYQS